MMLPAWQEDVLGEGTPIVSLEGIQYFYNLQNLYCADIGLTSLDVSALSKLTQLTCMDNALGTLDLSKNTALTQINGDITPVADTLRAHDKTAAFNQEVTAIWEVRHLIELAEVMLHASESRQESRGSMQRLDFPERDDEHFLAHSMVADDGSVSFKPEHITDYPPKKREY